MSVMLSQNPHKANDPREKVLEVAIGKAIRKLRKARGTTLAELSEQTGISVGMLSKIESGSTSPSLSTLETLANSLSVSITEFFKHFEERREAVHTKAGDAVEIVGEGTRAGHQYNLLGHIGSNASGVVVEPYMITLTTASDTFEAFQHSGIETIYMLEGAVDYRHGADIYPLRPGDTLFFDADAPHGPENLVQLPARYLSVICYPQGT